MRHKRSIPNRGFRVADQIQRDVAELIRDLKDPRIGMVTIHAVEVTPDYAHAKVFFSVLVGDAQECETALNEAAGYLRNGLFKRLQIHTVPTLHFVFDRTTERAAELNMLIKQANATRAKDDWVQRQRIVRRPVHGVLLLDKPVGLSSNDALQKAKRLYRAEKAGHTGTLDPLASGLLPLAFGAATKFSQASLDADKRYLATLQLGETRVGGDLEGEVIERRPVQVTADALRVACDRYTGAIEQVPPMHSALKHEGRALYEYARAGVEVERAPRRVTIHAIDIVAGDHDRWTLDVRCSKGTYIRTLAEDIGQLLGCGAHLAALRRTGSGGLTLEQAVTLEALEAMSEAERDALLLPADALVADCPAVRLAAEDAARFLAGMRRRLDLPDADCVRVFGPEPRAFLGSGHIVAGELISTRLLSPTEVQGLVATERQP